MKYLKISNYQCLILVLLVVINKRSFIRLLLQKILQTPDYNKFDDYQVQTCDQLIVHEAMWNSAQQRHKMRDDAESDY